ncbi:MAG: hypothetical protein QOJ31_246 [Gaiellales bacterium]|jgi:hypothetical protein|nr:hypothetical protein [Gaiellales bacterium]MDX6549562.1 hypothetical protein [Gaiellales bacterium]
MIDVTCDRHHEVQTAIATLDSGLCVWCEHAPAAMTSYLCESCRTQDVDGLLRRPVSLRVLHSSQAAA